MSLLTLFKLLNLGLCIANGIILFMPKKPMQGIHSNAAGVLAVIVLTMIVALVIEVVLTFIGWYYNKTGLLIGLFIVMIPLSLMMWYFLLWM